MANKDKMGLFSCVALIIGACIGSAIFSISGVTIYYAGASAILSWVLAAFIYGLYGLLVTELASIFPRSGGIYIFPRLAIGGDKGIFLGFLSGWGYIISNIIAIAFSAIYIGIYLAAGFPALKSGTLIAVISILAAIVILSVSNRRSQRIQNVLVVILIAIIVFYCALALFGGGFDTSGFADFFTSGSKGKSGFLSAIPLAMVAYGGCVSIAFIATEVRRPEKNIHRSLFIGLGIVALLYAALIASIVGTLPISILYEDEGMRYIPLFASISHGGLSAYPWLTKIICICITIALLTTICILLRVNSRAMQAISKEGLLPAFIKKDNKQGTAYNALLVMAVICCALCFKPEWTEEMIKLGAVLNIVSMTITCFSLIAAKKKAVTSAIVTVIILVICYIPEINRGSRTMWIFTASVYIAGLIFYLIYRKRSSRHPLRVSGTVVHGKGHGRIHSIPTANLELDEGCDIPVFGVWATKVFIEDKEYRGLTNVGYRPTDDDFNTPTVETKVIDYDGDLYGKRMSLEFLRYIRGTRKFANMEELHRQIEEDFSKIK
ncbi:MAG: amino acid permease [Bacteroidales bacterium]|nr:amino acid permease [Bacteroidales bacterium]